jgi:hypothetical protein
MLRLESVLFSFFSSMTFLLGVSFFDGRPGPFLFINNSVVDDVWTYYQLLLLLIIG